MTGTVRVEDCASQRRKHDHAVLTLDDGTELRFNDPRRFGRLEVQRRGKDGWPESLAGIGVEPLSKDFTGEILHAASRGRKKSVKELIMDNALVTGIGNIYAAETLFACGIRPQRPASRLTRSECDAIVQSSAETHPAKSVWESWVQKETRTPKRDFSKKFSLETSVSTLL